jgi:hypothetical protein
MDRRDVPENIELLLLRPARLAVVVGEEHEE